MPINVITLPTSMAPPALRAQYGLPPVAPPAQQPFAQGPSPVVFGSSGQAPRWGLLTLGLGVAAFAAREIGKLLSPNRPASPPARAHTEPRYTTAPVSTESVRQSYDPMLFIMLSDKAAELGRNMTVDEIATLAREQDVPERELMTVAKGFGYVEENPRPAVRDEETPTPKRGRAGVEDFLARADEVLAEAEALQPGREEIAPEEQPG